MFPLYCLSHWYVILNFKFINFALLLSIKTSNSYSIFILFCTDCQLHCISKLPLSRWINQREILNTIFPITYLCASLLNVNKFNNCLTKKSSLSIWHLFLCVVLYEMFYWNQIKTEFPCLENQSFVLSKTDTRLVCHNLLLVNWCIIFQHLFIYSHDSNIFSIYS